MIGGCWLSSADHLGLRSPVAAQRDGRLRVFRHPETGDVFLSLKLVVDERGGKFIVERLRPRVPSQHLAVVSSPAVQQVFKVDHGEAFRGHCHVFRRS